MDAEELFTTKKNSLQIEKQNYVGRLQTVFTAFYFCCVGIFAFLRKKFGKNIVLISETPHFGRVNHLAVKDVVEFHSFHTHLWQLSICKKLSHYPIPIEELFLTVQL